MNKRKSKWITSVNQTKLVSDRYLKELKPLLISPISNEEKKMVENITSITFPTFAKSIQTITVSHGDQRYEIKLLSGKKDVRIEHIKTNNVYIPYEEISFQSEIILKLNEIIKEIKKIKVSTL